MKLTSLRDYKNSNKTLNKLEDSKKNVQETIKAVNSFVWQQLDDVKLPKDHILLISYVLKDDTLLNDRASVRLPLQNNVLAELLTDGATYYLILNGKHIYHVFNKNHIVAIQPTIDQVIQDLPTNDLATELKVQIFRYLVKSNY
ncbi:MAG: hypothetical protein [Caudoviricetes sp.]|nr:MAG: hypothetical protein [Caudoviricetes sp.]